MGQLHYRAVLKGFVALRHAALLWFLTFQFSHSLKNCRHNFMLKVVPTQKHGSYVCGCKAVCVAWYATAETDVLVQFGSNWRLGPSTQVSLNAMANQLPATAHFAASKLPAGRRPVNGGTPTA